MTKGEAMSVWIHKIETAVPETRYSQSDIGRQMVEWTLDERDKRLVRMLYKGSGIEYRHSVIPDLGASFLSTDADGTVRQQTTAQRNAIYTREASKLALQLGRKLLASGSGIDPAQISHVITASCTGFFNPGIDYLLCRDLELSPTTRRFHLGFMGCYAAFPALNMAAQFCLANPEATVLVMCLELCTLHLQINGSEDTILANSLFSDGAAAMVVSARPPQPGSTAFRICDFESALIPSGVDAMAWSLGDLGFDISLSSYVPKIIGAGISQLLQPLLSRNALSAKDIRRWAVHPGGKSIIDKVAASLDLAAEQVQPSRDVLRNFGNMSCATILFVLKEMMTQPPPAGAEQICAVAFGPGLTVEMGLLELQSCPA
jgi:predicted naringenin-chalcone synthase